MASNGFIVYRDIQGVPRECMDSAILLIGAVTGRLDIKSLLGHLDRLLCEWSRSSRNRYKSCSAWLNIRRNDQLSSAEVVS